MANPIDSISPRLRIYGAAAEDPIPQVDPDDIAAEPAAPRTAWGRAGPPVSCALSDPDVDFDHCGTVRIRNPVLFHPDDTHVERIRVEDVSQRQMSDCYLMAVLAGLASKPEGRAILHGAIAENKNPNGTVESYTVTLHETYRLGLFGTLSLERKIRVEPEYARGHAAAGKDQGQRVVWPMVIERAYAKLSGGYDAMAHGGRAKTAFEVITGKPVRNVSLAGGGYSPRDLQRDLASGHILVVSTPPAFSDDTPYHLYPAHAYLVKGVVEQGGQSFLELHNPWNRDEPALVPLDELGKCFDTADIGSTS
jgi:hypothetical protein